MGKAYLELSEWDSASGGAGRRIEFQFNPNDFSVSQSANWEPGGSATVSEYKGAQAQSMSVKMFLDATDRDDGDVVAEVEALFATCVPTAASISKNKPLPPRVKFGWDRVHFEGYVKDVSVDYELFQPDGRPIRAMCTVALQEVERPPAGQNPTSGTRTVHRTVEVVVGDTLPALAYKEYGDPARWRAIAELNDIDDPLRLRPGTHLLVPPAAPVPA